MLFDHMSSKINGVMKMAAENAKELALATQRRANFYENLANGDNFKLQDLKCLGHDRLGIPEKMGVYIIFYKTEDQDFCAAIGHGVIQSRLGSFKKTLSGHSGDYNAAKKARRVDNNILNYYFSYVEIDDKNISKEFEKLLIERYEPRYNSQSSAGV